MTRRRRSWRVLALAWAVCGVAAAHAQTGGGYDRSIATSTAARRVDIVGLRLGMTPAEIKAAIAAHDPKLEIQVTESTVELADGTPRSFVTSIGAERRVVDPEAMDVSFSQPPRPVQAVGIIRRKEYVIDAQPDYAPVRKALLEQYGRPSAESVQGAVPGEAVDLAGQGGGIVLEWRLDDDKAKCVELRQAKRAPRPSSLGGRAPAECSALLVAWIGIHKGVVTAVTTALSDPALSALARVEYQAYHRAQHDERVRRERQKQSAPGS